MKWPEFEARFPGAVPSTFLKLGNEMRRIGPVMWRVEYDGRTAEMPDKPGVLADIAEVFSSTSR